MGGDHHGAGAKEFAVAQKIAECRYARIIRTTAGLVEDQQFWRRGKRHDDRQAATLTIGELPWWCIKQIGDLKALGDRFGTRSIACGDVRTSRSRAKKET